MRLKAACPELSAWTRSAHASTSTTASASARAASTQHFHFVSHSLRCRAYPCRGRVHVRAASTATASTSDTPPSSPQPQSQGPSSEGPSDRADFVVEDKASDINAGLDPHDNKHSASVHASLDPKLKHSNGSPLGADTNAEIRNYEAPSPTDTDVGTSFSPQEPDDPESKHRPPLGKWDNASLNLKALSKGSDKSDKGSDKGNKGSDKSANKGWPDRWPDKAALDALRNHTSTILASLDARRQRLVEEGGRRLSTLNVRINEATGYKEVERLKQVVHECEQTLNDLRRAARQAKAVYESAHVVRSTAQRDVNSLLERKHSWSDADLSRFTQLVRSDHASTQAVAAAAAELEETEAAVDRAFTDLTRAILERYHEEQVWSDKIRSVSTWAGVVGLAVNLVVFLGAIAVVEPWKRRRLVERLEERMAGMMSRVESGITTLAANVDQSLHHTPAHAAASPSILPSASVLPAPASIPSPAPDTTVSHADQDPRGPDLAALPDPSLRGTLDSNLNLDLDLDLDLVQPGPNPTTSTTSRLQPLRTLQARMTSLPFGLDLAKRVPWEDWDTSGTWGTWGGWGGRGDVVAAGACGLVSGIALTASFVALWSRG